MRFEEAIRRSIEAYWEGIEPEAYFKEVKKRPKYTKKYFDNFESKLFGNNKTVAKEMEDE